MWEKSHFQDFICFFVSFMVSKLLAVKDKNLNAEHSYYTRSLNSF